MRLTSIKGSFVKRFFQHTRGSWHTTLLIMFFAQSMVSVGFSSVFPFLPLYVRDLGSSTGLSVELLSGLVFSAQSVTMMLASPFWGQLADRVGRKMMVERAIFGGSVLLLIMAFVRNAEQLVLMRAIQGLISGVHSASYALVASQAPREQTGYAMGLLQVGAGAGVALGPMVGGAVADMYGYRAAFYVTSAMMFLAGLLVLVGVHEKFEPVPASKRVSFGKQWREIFSLPGVPVAYSLRFLTQLGRMTVVPLLPVFILSLMPDGARVNTFTGLVTGASSAMMTISAVGLGKLGDRIGHRKIVVACGLLAAMVYLPQGAVQAAWQLLVLQLVLGLAMGGLTPAISALLANYTPHGWEGAAYGLDSSIMSAARAVAPMVGSAIAMGISVRAAFPLSAVLFFVLTTLALTSLPRMLPAQRQESEEATPAD